MLTIENVDENALNDAIQDLENAHNGAGKIGKCQWSVYDYYRYPDRNPKHYARVDVWLPGNFGPDGPYSMHCNDIVGIEGVPNSDKIEVSDDYSESDVTGNHNPEIVAVNSERELAKVVIKHINEMVTAQEHKYSQDELKEL